MRALSIGLSLSRSHCALLSFATLHDRPLDLLNIYGILLAGEQAKH